MRCPSGLLSILFVLFPIFLFSAEASDRVDSIIEHQPPSTFLLGDKIEIKITAHQEIEWAGWFYKYDGLEDFNAETLAKKDDNIYSFTFDSGSLPAQTVEYYFAFKSGGKIQYLPENFRDNLFRITGSGKPVVPITPGKVPEIKKEEKLSSFRIGLNGHAETSLVDDNAGSGDFQTQHTENLKLQYQYQKSDLNIRVESRLSYSSLPVQNEDDFDLPDLKASIGIKNSHFNLGDISFNESRFSVNGIGRRGMEYVFDNQKLYFHVFTFNTQQLKGFKGFGIPETGTAAYGGALGYSFFSRALSLKLVYLSGKDDPELGANVVFSDIFKKSEGSIIALLADGRFLKNKLRLESEFAFSDYDRDTEDDQDAVTSKAWRVGGNFSQGIFSLSGEYRFLGNDFNSVAQPFMVNDRQGLDTRLGFNLKKFSLSGRYFYERNNTDNDPAVETARNNEGSVELSWKFIPRATLRLGYNRGIQNLPVTPLITIEEELFRESYSAMLDFNLGKGASFNLAFRHDDISCEQAPEQDGNSYNLNSGITWVQGQRLSLNAYIGLSRTIRPATDEEIKLYTAFLSGNVYFIPRILFLSFSGSYASTGITGSDTSEIYSLDSGLNLEIRNIFKTGRIVITLSGFYRHTDFTGTLESNTGALLKCDFSF